MPADSITPVNEQFRRCERWPGTRPVAESKSSPARQRLKTSDSHPDRVTAKRRTPIRRRTW